MSDTAIEPKFRHGQRVRSTVELFNDGSFPNAEPGALLVAAGAPGEIVEIGTHVETDTTLYLVAFGEDRVIGCLGEEIGPVVSRPGLITSVGQEP